MWESKTLPSSMKNEQAISRVRVLGSSRGQLPFAFMVVPQSWIGEQLSAVRLRASAKPAENNSR